MKSSIPSYTIQGIWLFHEIQYHSIKTRKNFLGDINIFSSKYLGVSNKVYATTYRLIQA